MRNILLSVLITLLLSSCNSKESPKENALKKIAGNWSVGTNNAIKFALQDTVGLCILTSSLHDYVGSKQIEYPIGSVLFKSIQMFTDSSFVAQGLLIKPIFKTEDVQKYGWTGYKWGYYYEQEQIFDHFENTYVDYRIELRLNMVNTLDGISNIKCDLLTCIPFSEGKKWEFIRWTSAEDSIRYNKGQLDQANRLVDSMDSIDQAERNSEHKRMKEEDDRKTKRAQELLK
ncbi:MAG: hypothetical protein ACOYMF_18870 [Bacteroidales bacterium]